MPQKRSNTNNLVLDIMLNICQKINMKQPGFCSLMLFGFYIQFNKLYFTLNAIHNKYYSTFFFSTTFYDVSIDFLLLTSMVLYNSILIPSLFVLFLIRKLNSFFYAFRKMNCENI